MLRKFKICTIIKYYTLTHYSLIVFDARRFSLISLIIFKVSNKCKSCRFDKCILMGMNIQKLRNPQQSTISLWEIRSKIEQRLGELALIGKYPEKRNKIFASSEGIDFSFMQTIFLENEETKIIGNLLLLEESVGRIRNSSTQITDKNYDFSYKTLEEVINRKENSIFLCYDYLVCF
uniref:Nuclear receptor domain-containing protein n=1 Tax=Meloidogyne incognita TaxID=6306 RepID=A0A914N4U2_MELIC